MGSFSVWHWMIVLIIVFIIFAVLLRFIFGALRAGIARPGPQSMPQSKAAQLAALHDLLKTGALTQDEFDNQKRKILES